MQRTNTSDHSERAFCAGGFQLLGLLFWALRALQPRRTPFGLAFGVCPAGTLLSSSLRSSLLLLLACSHNIVASLLVMLACSPRNYASLRSLSHGVSRCAPSTCSLRSLRASPYARVASYVARATLFLRKSCPGSRAVSP